MNWWHRFILSRAEAINRKRYQEEERSGLNKAAVPISLSLKEDIQQAEDPIRFDLSSAVGGRILNVRRYDRRSDRNDSTTYVIPSGEDVGQRVSKIINLEILK